MSGGAAGKSKRRITEELHKMLLTSRLSIIGGYSVTMLSALGQSSWRKAVAAVHVSSDISHVCQLVLQLNNVNFPLAAAV